jgi:general secretion pathway protein L
MAISTSSVPFLVTLNRRVTSFWQWWIGELSDMVPKRLKMAFAGDASLVDVMVSDDALVHVRATGNALHEVKRVPAGSIEELLRSAGRDVRVVIPPTEVLRKKVVLPLATEENLLDVVGFDMDRQTPFTADQVYFGARIAHRDAARERLDVNVVAVPRTMLEPALAQMRAAGMSIHSIVAADEITGGATPTELLPRNAEPARRWSAMQRLNVGLIVAGLLLLLIATVLPIWQKRETVRELIPLSAKVGAEYKVTQKIVDEYTRLANEFNYIAGKKHGVYPTVMLLDEITKISPDTTWIQNFELKSLAKTRELQLTGEAAAVSKVIESLEQTPFLQNTSQRAQTRQGSRPNVEFFTLASEVKPRPLPEAKVPDAAQMADIVSKAQAAANAPVSQAPSVTSPPAANAGSPAVPVATVTPAPAPTGAVTKSTPPPAGATAPAPSNPQPKSAGPPVPTAPQPSPAVSAMPVPPTPPASTPSVGPTPAAGSIPMPPMPSPGAGGPQPPLPGTTTSGPQPPLPSGSASGGPQPPRPGLQLPFPGSPGSAGTGVPAGPVPPPPSGTNAGPPLPNPVSGNPPTAPKEKAP